MGDHDDLESVITIGWNMQFMHEERPNLRLDLNLDAMSASDRDHAATVLREALNRLSALDQAFTPGPHEAKQVAFTQDGSCITDSGQTSREV